MAKSVQAFIDNRGHLHTSARSAVIGDIAAALGRVGEEGGLTEGVARLILERRKFIEQAFADLDSLDERRPVLIESSEASTVEVLDLEDHRKQR
ncbi:hypothetical protein [Aurantiacibacter rhizosphaerae]|uniref:hypothetical protein n=1 Tax=Aurantiacibacter rhizosphaerae TaxID=2691582 RepID=UPI001922DBBF|nr:hypothetical protein [Aurantiacibacter rhizosphaerae]